MNVWCSKLCNKLHASLLSFCIKGRSIFDIVDFVEEALHYCPRKPKYHENIMDNPYCHTSLYQHIKIAEMQPKSYFGHMFALKQRNHQQMCVYLGFLPICSTM